MGGIEIKTLRDQAAPVKAKIAGERMMFTADGSTLVRGDDERAVSLAVAEGHRMHPDLVAKFGIKGGKLATSGENKARKGTANKGA